MCAGLPSLVFTPGYPADLGSSAAEAQCGSCEEQAARLLPQGKRSIPIRMASAEFAACGQDDPLGCSEGAPQAGVGHLRLNHAFLPLPSCCSLYAGQCRYVKSCLHRNWVSERLLAWMQIGL